MGDFYVQQINEGLGDLELLRGYLWEFSLNPVAGVMQDYTGISGGATQVKPKALMWRCKGTSIPELTNEVIEHNFKGTKVSYAGRDGSGKSFSTTFIDGQDLMITNYIRGWNAFMLYNNKSTYATNASITLLGRSNKPIARYYFFKMYPEGAPQMSLEYSSSDPIELAVTFRFDDMYAEVYGPDGGGRPMNG